MLIKAILFDMGGTLRENTKRDETAKVVIVKGILDLLKVSSSAPSFTKLLTDREKAYEEWASTNLIELDETGFWTQWMLPDWPYEIISRHAMKLNEIWRDAICTRKMFPEARSTIFGLYQRGYKLGLVSNTTSSVDTPLALKGAGIAQYLDVIILSCMVGKRKPGPDILSLAAEKIGEPPEYCVYVGDRPEWDVLASRGAGFGMSIILHNSRDPQSSLLRSELTPDRIISNLPELLDIFPDLH